MTGEPVRLTISRNEPEAEFLCSLLRAEGIKCMHRITDLAFGQGGEMPLSGGGPREVLVQPERIEDARELFAGIDESSAPDA